MIEVLLYISTLFVLYTYLGYPLLVFLLSRLKPKCTYELLKEEQLPSISIITPFINNEQAVKKRIENLKTLDYPTHKMDLIFISDGSKDQSISIIESIPLGTFNQVSLIENKQRQGKANALNQGIDQCQTQYIVFSDIRQSIHNNAIKYLMSQLISEPNIGCVSGNLNLLSPEGKQEDVGIYWKYESLIRKAESRLFSTIGVSGALYATRKCDTHPLHKDTLLDDFEMPIKMLKDGKASKYCEQAIFYDYSEKNIEKEEQRKVRTLRGNYQSIGRNKWLLNPFVNPAFWQFLSHKLFRLLVPYALVIIFISNIFLLDQHLNWKILFSLQLLFYGSYLLGKKIKQLRKIKPIGIIVIFIDLNLCALSGLKSHLTNEKGVWK